MDQWNKKIIQCNWVKSNNYHKAKVDKQRKYLRIKPINKFGAPARGATVTLITNQRKHAKTIDAGSGYLCQMEPVAHYGIRKDEKDFKVEVKWTDGTKNLIKINSLNQAIIVKQKWKKIYSNSSYFFL